MALAHEGLKTRQIVSAIYSCASVAEDQGWILMKHMSGTPLDASFEAMSSEKVLALLQLGFPKTIQLFGSLGFDREGKIVRPPLNVFRGGPSEIHQVMITSNSHEQLAAADKGLIKGWQANGVRPRLE